MASEPSAGSLDGCLMGEGEIFTYSCTHHLCRQVTQQREGSKTAHAWISTIVCMLNTYVMRTTKIKLFYSSKAVRLQGDTFMYTLFVLIYDLLNISLKSLTWLTATIFELNMKEDFPGYTLLPLMHMNTYR